MEQNARRNVYRSVRRSLEGDALLAQAGKRLAGAVEVYMKDGDRATLETALHRYRAAADQAPGSDST